MAIEVEKCPLCGAPASLSERKCSYCGAQFFVSSLAYISSHSAGDINKYIAQYKAVVNANPNDVEANFGLGLCYVALALFPMASRYISQAVEIAPENPKAYYYLALTRAGGRKLRSIPLKEIREIEALLASAIQLGSAEPEVKVFLAMLKRDYYDGNGLKVLPPRAETLLEELRGGQLNRNEFDRLLSAVLVGNGSSYAEGLTLV